MSSPAASVRELNCLSLSACSAFVSGLITQDIYLGRSMNCLQQYKPCCLLTCGVFYCFICLFNFPAVKTSAFCFFGWQCNQFATQSAHSVAILGCISGLPFIGGSFSRRLQTLQSPVCQAILMSGLCYLLTFTNLLALYVSEIRTL